MKSTITLAFAALVITFASCTSKPAETTETQDSVATEAPAAEPVTEPAVDSVAAPAVDSAAAPAQ